MHQRSTWANTHLDAVRGAAALIVMLGHARGLFFNSITGSVFSHVAGPALPHAASSIGTAVEQLATIGDEAVMVFFVLSGYLVGGSVVRAMQAAAWSWPSYLISRFVRLWIVLIPAILIGILIDGAGLHFLAHNGSIYTAPAGQPYVGPHLHDAIHSIPTILGNLFFLQDIFVPPLGTNVALWSLSNEFWYYLLFPLGLLAAGFERRLLLRLAYGCAAIAVAILIGPHARFLFLVWLLGVAVALLPQWISAQRAYRAVVIAALVFAAVFIGVKKFYLLRDTAEILVAVAVSVLIYTIKCQTTHCKTSLYGRAARWTSEISYTLYLTHLPFLVLMCALINSPWAISPIAPAALAKFATAIIATLAWVYLLYYLFESRTDAVRKALKAKLAAQAA